VKPARQCSRTFFKRVRVVGPASRTLVPRAKPQASAAPPARLGPGNSRRSVAAEGCVRSWGEDLTALAGIRERLARPELLAPEEVALLATQAEALVRSARSVLRRSEDAVDGLESGLGTYSSGVGRERTDQRLRRGFASLSRSLAPIGREQFPFETMTKQA
jgi:hypothetical protein